MSDVPTDQLEAELIVEGRLGRRPQDMLEAAVVLEAWAGVPACRALAASRALMPRTPLRPVKSVGRVPGPGPREARLRQASAFALTVIAIAFWAAPLSSSLGATVVGRALTLALPLTLALQWGLHSRYLNHPRGLAALAARRRTLSVVGCAVVGVPAAVVGVAGLLAGLLTLTWTAGTIVIACRRPAVYAATVLAATPVLLSGVNALPVLTGVAAATAGAVALFLRPVAAPARTVAGRRERALCAAAIGAGIGLMLVLDRTVSFSAGAVPALALLPSTIAGVWGGLHLRHLDQAIPRAVSGVVAADADAAAIAWQPLHVLLGAVGRLVALSAALSTALLALTPWLGADARAAGVLVGFCIVALATLLIGLLESLGRGTWALGAVALAAGAELVVRAAAPDAFAGAGLVVGGALAILVVLPGVIDQVARPARTLATALWIP